MKLLLVLISFCFPLLSEKLLVLVLASDNRPIYQELQKLWRSYMHYDPEHVEVYFIKSDPDLNVPYKIENDVIWSKMNESLKPGILNKTLLSLEAMLPRLPEFTYVLRTNLSSFFIFPELLNFLQNAPKKNYYAGGSAGPEWWPSGCGFILSRNLVYLLIHHKGSLWDNASDYDDVLLGHFFHSQNAPISHFPRLDLIKPEDFEHYKAKTPPFFHFRIKFHLDDNDKRLQFEPPIYSYFIEKFYQ